MLKTGGRRDFDFYCVKIFLRLEVKMDGGDIICN